MDPMGAWGAPHSRRAARWLAITAVAIAGALLMLAARPAAAADPLSCGDTITTDTTLQADLSCTGTALRIGADGVDLDLDGHLVESVCTEVDCSASIGIDNSGGYDGVRITDGTVGGVQYGVLLVDAGHNLLLGLDVRSGGYERVGSSAVRLEDSSRNRIADSDLDGGQTALELSGASRNVIADNTIFGRIDIHNGYGVEIEDGSSHNRLERNEIKGNYRGVVVADSNRNLIADNDVRGYSGALVVSDSARTTIARNELHPGLYASIDATDVTRSRIVANGGGPIYISGDRNVVAHNQANAGSFFPTGLDVAGGDRNVIRRNLVDGGRYGRFGPIRVGPAATRTLLAGNTVNGGVGNTATGGAPPIYPDGEVATSGIWVGAPGTIIRRNVAMNNWGLGIDAVPGVIDGGGNRAGGNLNWLQCVNVRCRPIG